MKKLKVFVDADACPVTKEIIHISGTFQLPVCIIKSYDHFSTEQLPAHVETFYVDKGADMADFEIVRRAVKGDLIVTHDYGLASLLLGKGCHVMHHKGFMYTKHNIDRLLANRHYSQMARRAGKRTKGPKAFTDDNRKEFELFFTDMLKKITIN